MTRVSLSDPIEATRRRSSARSERIFDGYHKSDGYALAFDEMFDAQGNVRGPYKGIYAELAPTDASELKARADALGRAFIDQGITFSLSGQERPFPLDLVPRVISAAEWTRLERGIIQRVQALERYLDDIYGDQEILRDGVIPRRLVTSCEHFHREAVGIVPPNGVRIHVAGIDLIRDDRGDFRVLEDNLRSPSGVSYVMENRRTMARVFPNLFATHRVRAVDDYPAHLLRALRNSAATNEADPTVVVLTPGSTTRPTSSIRCWPARWAWSWSKAATCSAGTTRCTCAPPRGAPGRRHLPAHRRRIPGPAAVPRRLGARGGGTGQRRPRRQCRHLQFDR
ncbi:hypothetical protein NIIDMKKI_21590 [Mycobacterium kansasii]|uniref:Circularly permuted ATPgrasp domain-containing protein n=1 Tax=Mycobacterium kansasii TaxID=1768 RepID=A0A7G1I9F6_MYCKA|nr:hypothetical protein NIIDMKKI_21590 [Mycobacterium kansasii]